MGFSFSENFVFLLILAIPLGLGAGSVDAALSNYVALHFKAKHMNWLHCFWGIGAVTGPLVMAYWLNQANNWRAGYVTVGLILLGIVVVLLSTLSLWRIFEKGRVEGSGDEKKRVSNREAIRIPGVKMSMLAMLCYNGPKLLPVCGWLLSSLLAKEFLQVLPQHYPPYFSLALSWDA